MIRHIAIDRLTGVAILGCLTFTAFAPTPVCGQRYGSVQSPARPFGLNIIDRVQLRNSDARARDFRTGFRWMNDVLSQPNGTNQTVSTGNGVTTLLDPGQIELVTDYNVRMYFVDESAGYHNTIGFNPNGQGIGPGASLIFPDASTASGRRTTSNPLKRGDFVDLGLVTGGSILDFFLIADGAAGGTDVFTLDAGANPDGLRHVNIQARVDADSPYLLLGFEDLLGGGDNDFGDSVLALDIGVANVQNLLNTVGAPEPGSFAAIGAFLAMGVANRRRRNGKGRKGKNGKKGQPDIGHSSQQEGEAPVPVTPNL